MSRSHAVALVIAALVTGMGITVVLTRGGLIGWSALVLGFALLLKVMLKPSSTDYLLGLSLAAFCALIWAGAYSYVIATWESGEVVEVVIDTQSGQHTARLWVLDIGEEPLIYYDAPAEAAEALMAGKPVRFTRAGSVSVRVPAAVRIEALPESKAAELRDAMEAKYEGRITAAQIFYGLLGRPRDRVALIATLGASEATREQSTIRKRSPGRLLR
ncbi:MAG: hypothetical protein AAGE43_15690 [Pseudomonadota bacterium]